MAPTDKSDNEEKRGAHLRVPDHLKKTKEVYVPTGKPRGRAPGQKNKKTLRAEIIAAAALSGGKGQGAHLRVPDHLKKPRRVPTGKPTGRAPGQKNKETLRREKMKEMMEEVAKVRVGGKAKK